MSIGVAIIGNGMAARVFHAPYIAATPALALRAVVSRRLDAPPPAPGVPLVGDVDAVLGDDSIALVVIATPSDTHAALARQALLAGKHVVVEKPFALDLAQAQGLVELARERGLCLAAFHNRRWDSDFLSVRAAIESGLIGEVVQFESHFDRFRPNVRDRWREAGGPGSGVWYDLGPHLVDQALALFGAPVAVSADLAAMRPGSGADDWAHVVLRYANRRVVLHAGMVVAGGTARFTVHGMKGSLQKTLLDPQEAQSVAGLRPGDEDWGIDPDALRHWDEQGAEHRIPAQRGCQQQFYAAMADAILGDGPPPNTGEQILAVQAVIEAAMLSASEGRLVTL
jgi:predicted dehydrogenase